VETSAWKWVAIAFMVLFAIAALSALGFYYDYSSTASIVQRWANYSYEEWNSAIFEEFLLHLENETTLVSNQTVSEPPSSAYDFNFNIQYAGYIEVIVSSSSNTYVEISGTYSPPSSWHSPNRGWTYDSGKIQVGRGGIVFFPVVPGTVMVAIGNNANSSATATVTIVYYS
jgi:hypothetical protein